MTDQPPPLDALTEALAVLDAAQTHGYTAEAAYQAALARLADVDGDRLREVAAGIAAMAAWWVLIESWSRQPGPLQLARWLTYTRCRVAGGEEP